MDEYRPGPPRSPVAAALLNLTGLGLGYSYLGRWWRQALHLVITAGLVVIAFATGAAALPWLWVAAAVGWLGWMAVDAWRLARDLHPRPGSAAGRAVPIAVAVVLVGALVTGYVLYGAAGGRAYADAAAARDRGDCATAVDGFGTVTGVYELTLSGDVARADAGRAECAAFLAAGAAEQRGEFAEAVRLYGEFRRANPGTALAPFVEDDLRRTYERWGTRLRAAGDYDEAIRVYRDLLVEVGDGPEAAGVRAQIAAAYVERADALRVQVASLTGQPRVDAVRGAIENLLVVSREFADTPSAPAASQGIVDTYTAAAAGGCEAIPALDYVVALTDAETAGIVATATVDRPGALFQCGLTQYEAGSWGESSTTFDRFVAEYPDDPQNAQARADAIAARASAVTGTPPAALPGPFAGDTPGPIPVTLYNDNPAEVRVYVLGPTAHEIVLPGCAGCPASYATDGEACPTFDGRPSARLTLPAGDYTIISQYATTNPAVQTSAVERGFEYTNCLYVGP